MSSELAIIGVSLLITLFLCAIVVWIINSKKKNRILNDKYHVTVNQNDREITAKDDGAAAPPVIQPLVSPILTANEQKGTPSPHIIDENKKMVDGNESPAKSTIAPVPSAAKEKAKKPAEKTNMNVHDKPLVSPKKTTRDVNKQRNRDFKINKEPPHRKIAKLWRLPNDCTTCYRCEQKLQEEQIQLMVYANKLNKTQYKYFIVRVYTCEKCRYSCASNSIIHEIQRRSQGWVEVVEWGTIPTSSSVNHTQKEEFRWPSTHAIETRNTLPKLDQGIFDTESDLHRLGYNISKTTRERRWWILENEALPKLGLEKVANTIASNVRARKRQKNGAEKYRYAIAEWEHDLQKLKQKYYRRNFIWPRTD